MEENKIGDKQTRNNIWMIETYRWIRHYLQIISIFIRTRKGCGYKYELLHASSLWHIRFSPIRMLWVGLLNTLGGSYLLAG